MHLPKYRHLCSCSSLTNFHFHPLAGAYRGGHREEPRAEETSDLRGRTQNDGTRSCTSRQNKKERFELKILVDMFCYKMTWN